MVNQKQVDFLNARLSDARINKQCKYIRVVDPFDELEAVFTDNSFMVIKASEMKIYDIENEGRTESDLDIIDVIIQKIKDERKALTNKIK